VRLGFCLKLPDKIEVTAVANGLQDRAGLRAIICDQYGSGQVFRICIDREAKKNELQERNPDHHSKRQPIAAHLDELLNDHGAEPREGERPSH
jgi:hypothetical protein